MTNQECLVRLNEILPRVGLSKAGWYKAIRYGRIEPPIKVGRMSVWKLSYIDSLVERMASGTYKGNFTKAA